MEEQVSWHVHLAVKPGQLENFRSLNDEMVESTREETDALVYERFLNEDGTDVHIYERLFGFARGGRTLTVVQEQVW